jgi:hypothetical protein
MVFKCIKKTCTSLVICVGQTITITFHNNSNFEKVEVTCENEQRLLSPGGSTTFTLSDCTKSTPAKVKVYNGDTLIREVGFDAGRRGHARMTARIEHDGVKAQLSPFHQEDYFPWSYVKS